MRRTREQPSPLRRLGPRGILALILAVLVVIFVAENTRRVRIRFIAGPEVKAPVWLALLIAAVVGALAGLLLQHLRNRR